MRTSSVVSRNTLRSSANARSSTSASIVAMRLTGFELRSPRVNARTSARLASAHDIAALSCRFDKSIGETTRAGAARSAPARRGARCCCSMPCSEGQNVAMRMFVAAAFRRLAGNERGARRM